MARVLLALLVWVAVACDHAGNGAAERSETAVTQEPPADHAASPAASATAGDEGGAVAEAAAAEAEAAPAETGDLDATTGMGDADVVKAVATQADDGRWTFEVTVSHPDTGWQDYANGWDVVLPDGTVVKRRKGDAFTRPLGHPHVDEQPFTRSQSRLVIPEDVQRVTVRAHELKHGFGGKTVEVDLPSADR